MRIAIDGPAGSGKSTLGEALASKLSYLYFDTGVMYRAVTLAVLQRGIAIEDETAVTRLAQLLEIVVTSAHATDGRQYTVLLDGVDVTWSIRQPQVDALVSIPSKYPGVRAEMVRQQRRIAAPGNCVMVGRDIGTTVLPEADLKIYLTASVEERARRRFQEEAERGVTSDYQYVLADMRHRDNLDSTRETSPLRPASDALIIDSTNRSVREIVEQILEVIGKMQMPKTTQ
ncbi:MAG TPA: (d)CMP kinase [Anaerolineae bacterium]